MIIKKMIIIKIVITDVREAHLQEVDTMYRVA